MVKTFTRAVLCTLLAAIAMISSDAFAATYIAYSSSGMSASQSSDFSGNPGANGASAALDGNTSAGSMAGWDGGFLLDKNGEKTSSNENLDYGRNWWIVDFGKELSIDAVKIFFEGNSETHASATEFKVEYFDVDPSVEGAQAKMTTTVEGNAAKDCTVTENNTVTARYVRLNFKSAAHPEWGIKFYEVQFLRDLDTYDSYTIAPLNEPVRLFRDCSSEIPFALKGIKDGNADFISLPDSYYEISGLSDGLTYADGRFTASAVGEFSFTVTLRDNEAVTSTIKGECAEVSACLTFADGKPTAEVTFSPAQDKGGTVNLSAFFNNEGDGNGEKGWTPESVVLGKNYYLIDLKTLSNIDLVRIGQTGATISAFTLRFYGYDGETEIASASYTNSRIGDQYITFANPVKDVRYIRMYVDGTSTGYGACISRFVAYGEKVKPVAVALDIDDEPLLTDVGYKLDAVLTYSGGVTSLTSDYTVESITPDEGLTFADGEFKATVAGTYTVKIAAEGVEGEASLTFSYIGVNLLHNGGDFGTQFWFHPSQDANGETLLQGNESWLVDKSVTTGNYGWKDRALGDEKTLEKGKAFFTFGMRRLCNVEVVRIHHAQSKITSFTLEFFKLNPEIPENKGIEPVYTNDYTNDTEDWQEIKLPETLKDVRFVRLHVTGMSNPEWGARISEIEVLGKGPNDKVYVADSYKLSRRDVPKGDYYTATVNGYDSANDVLLDEIDDKFVVIKVSDTQEKGFTGKINTHDTKGGNQPNGFIEGLERGLVNVTVSVKNDDGDVVGTFDDVIEVTTKDWSKLVNIARSYRTYAQGDNRNAVDNGMTDGNPRSRVYVGNTKGGVNEYPDGLIDGDWHAWTISTAELAQEEKPYVIVDLGAAYPVNEFNLHWNADGDGEGNGSYFLMKGDYEVYGFAGDFEGEPDAKAEGWKSLYTVKSNDPGRYDVGRHVFRTENVRYMMFRFTAPMYATLPVAINEITIGGPSFVDAEGNLVRYEQGDIARIATPRFDRSLDDTHRDLNRNFIVALKNYYSANPLYVAYQVLDCYGRSLVEEGDDAEYIVDDTENASFKAVASGTQVKWRNIDWTATSRVFHPTALGKYNVRINIKDQAGNVKYTTDALDIYVISELYNVNRYANAYDNAVNTAAGWNDATNPDKTGDRDWTATGTAPQNASDGNFGSWWVIGYYGDADHMGSTYKYPANTTLERPYELVMDYRGDEATDTPKVYAKEIDMISVLFEGAYPRDYDVYILPMEDKNGTMTVKKDADGNDDWEKVKAFNNLLPMGVGCEENHRIYRMTAEGLPDVDANGRIKPWENIAAVKLVFRATGTQWGLKIKESALYGKLNAPVVPTSLRQARYDDAAAAKEVTQGRFYGFDLVAALDIDREVLEQQGTEITAELAKTLDDIVGYDIVMKRWKLNDTGDGYVAYPFGQTAADHPALEGGEVKDGDFVFRAAPDVLEDSEDVQEGDFYNYFNHLVVKDVDPGKFYSFEAFPVLKEGSESSSVAFEILESPVTSLVIPGASIVFKDASLDAYEGEISGVRHDAAELDGTHHHGSLEGKHNVVYNKGNVYGVNGVLTPVFVTDEVLSKYDLVLNVDASASGSDYQYSRTFGAGEYTGLINRTDMPVALSYLPLPAAVKSVAELGNVPEGTPQAITDKKVNVPAIPAKFDGSASSSVTYRRKAVDYTTAVAPVSKVIEATVDDNFSTEGVNGKLRALDGWINNEIHLIKRENEPYNAFIGLRLNEVARPLNSFAGFYATNDYHESADLAADEIKGGRPFGSSNEPWYGIADYNWSADNGNDNFGGKVLNGGRLGVYLQNMAGVDATKAEILVDSYIYLFTTNEYPILLGAPASNGELGDDAYPTFALTLPANGGNAAYAVNFDRRVEAAGAKRRAAGDGTDNVQPVTVPLIYKIKVGDHEKGLEIMTSVGSVADDMTNGNLNVYPSPADSYVNVAADKALGDVSVYSLEGALVKSVRTDDNVVVLDIADLSSGIYVVRAAGATARLIKK